MSVNQLLTHLEVRMSLRSQPTHCRNVRPEGFSLVVLLEVNSAVIQAGMCKKAPRVDEIEHFEPVHIEYFFPALKLCHLNTKCFLFVLFLLSLPSRSFTVFSVASDLRSRHKASKADSSVTLMSFTV